MTLQLSLGPWWGFGDPDGVAQCESGRALGSTWGQAPATEQNPHQHIQAENPS